MNLKEQDATAVAAGGSESPSRAWLRALERTASIRNNPGRIFPRVMEEVAETFDDAPALLSDLELSDASGASGAIPPLCPLGVGSRSRSRRHGLPDDAEPA
jgi:hypothetical protein